MQGVVVVKEQFITNECYVLFLFLSGKILEESLLQSAVTNLTGKANMHLQLFI
jgi:hypothetical protein